MSVTSLRTLPRAARPVTPEPGPRRSWQVLLVHPVVLAMVATAALAALWIGVFPTAGTDLSAQIARADFAQHYPRSAYDFSWYAGIYPAGYSVLAPYLFAFGGTRMVTAGAAVACAGLIALMLVRHNVARPKLAALWAATGLWTGLISGRATFTLGLAAAVAAVAVIDTRWAGDEWTGRAARLGVGAVLAMLASLFSPVAGLFVGVAAAALVITRRWVVGIGLGLAAGVPLGVVGLVFGTSGVQPITALNGGPAMLAAGLAVVLLPRQWRAVRVGSAVYFVGVLMSWILPTAIGSNVERLGLLLIGPLLAATVVADVRKRGLFVFGIVGAVVWQVVSPIRDLTHSDAPLTSAASTAPLARELVRLRADRSRLEAVPQYGHWEAQQLASIVPLARGWERQLDTVRNPLFYHGHLSAAEYHGWLHHNAVGYVAISSAQPDYAASREAEIVRSGQPWLDPVWHDANWKLYRVTDATPLADKPAVVQSTTPASITVSMPRAGSTMVRIRWSRFLQTSGGGTVQRDHEWTRLTVPHGGKFVLSASY